MPGTRVKDLACFLLQCIQFASQQEVDKTFGIYDKGGKFYIGDSPIEIDGDNITVKGKEYLGTEGLWELRL